MVTLGNLLKSNKKIEKKQNYIEDFNLNSLRGWQREQLKLLKKLVDYRIVNGAAMANASGTAVKSSEFGGKITALTRAGLMVKAGREKDGNNVYQLNENKVERKTLKDFLEKLGI